MCQEANRAQMVKKEQSDSYSEVRLQKTSNNNTQAGTSVKLDFRATHTHKECTGKPTAKHI